MRKLILMLAVWQAYRVLTHKKTVKVEKVQQETEAAATEEENDATRKGCAKVLRRGFVRGADPDGDF